MARPRRRLFDGRLMGSDLGRRRWLIWAGVFGSASAAAPVRTAGAASRSASGAEPVSLRAPEPLSQLRVDRQGALLAVTRTGKALRATTTAWQTLGAGLDPQAPLATGHGRVVGRSASGKLWMWESDRAQVIPGPDLAPHAGLLVLAFGIIAVTREVDGTHRLVRLDPHGAAWTESARSRSTVLPDARPLQFDPAGKPTGAGADDNGHVLVFGAPSDTRYRHGVLGDAVEPTSLILLERHGLETMARIELAAPYVFEDIAPRPIAWRGARALLTVRSGPLGAQLCVVAQSAGTGDRFELAALGEPIGTPRRWLAPSTDGQRLLAVHTPHLGGVLHLYQPQQDRLSSRILARGVSNHAIGQRDLDVSAWVGSQWVVPARDGRQLWVIDLAATHAEAAPAFIQMPGPVSGLKAWPRGADDGVAVLLQDGCVWWVPIRA